MTDNNIPQPPPILTLSDLDEDRKVAPRQPSAFNKMKQMKQAETGETPVQSNEALTAAVHAQFPPVTAGTAIADGYTTSFPAISDEGAVKDFAEILEGPEDSSVRHISTNPNATPESLKEFMKSDNPKVRAAVAANPNTPVKVLLKLCKDKESIVLASVAENPNFPAKYAPKLLKAAKNFTSVSDALKARDDVPERLLKKLP